MKIFQISKLSALFLSCSLPLIAISTPIYIVNKGTGENMSVIGRHIMNKGKGAWSTWSKIKNKDGKIAPIASNKAGLYDLQCSDDHEYACVLGDKYNWSSTATTYPLEYKGGSFAGKYAWVISGKNKNNKKLMTQEQVVQDVSLAQIIPLPRVPVKPGRFISEVC